MCERLSYLRENLQGEDAITRDATVGPSVSVAQARCAVYSIVAIPARGGWRCGLVSLFRGLRDDTLTALSSLWCIPDMIVSCQAGDFVSTQIRVWFRGSVILD